jgi:hypothetical protein
MNMPNHNNPVHVGTPVGWAISGIDLIIRRTEGYLSPPEEGGQTLMIDQFHRLPILLLARGGKTQA